MIDKKMFAGLQGILKRTIQVLELCMEISGKDFVNNKIMSLILSVAREEQNRLRGGRGGNRYTGVGEVDTSKPKPGLINSNAGILNFQQPNSST